MSDVPSKILHLSAKIFEGQMRRKKMRQNRISIKQLLKYR